MSKLIIAAAVAFLIWQVLFRPVPALSEWRDELRSIPCSEKVNRSLCLKT